jgi:hypothetical protein
LFWGFFCGKNGLLITSDENNIMHNFRLFEHFPGPLRTANEQGMMFHRIPGQLHRRFFTYDSVLMNVLEVLVYLREKFDSAVAKDFLVAKLLTVGSLMQLKNSSPPTYAAYVGVCLHFTQKELVLTPEAAMGVVYKLMGQNVTLGTYENSFARDSFTALMSASDVIKLHELPLRNLSAVKKVADVYPRAELLQTAIQALEAKVADMHQNNIDPFIIGAFLHQAIIGIHPLIDENGRTARRQVDRLLDSYKLKPVFNAHQRGVNSAAEIEYDQAAASYGVARFADYLRWRYVSLYPNSESVQLSKKIVRAIVEKQDLQELLANNCSQVAVSLPVERRGYPIHYACQQAQNEVVRALLAKGASLQVWSFKGTLPVTLWPKNVPTIPELQREEAWEVANLWEQPDQLVKK